MLWAQADGLADKVRDNWVYAAIAAGVLVALLVLYRIATGRKKRHPDLEKGLREDLASYPPPPAATGPKRLNVNGVPVRVRLVVVAPTGKLQTAIMPDDVPELLDDVVRGLGACVKADKPRIRVWPPQLSVAGFAPTFHRLVESPDRDAQASRWVKLAGPARTGERSILLGLALLADEPCKLGNVQVETTEWKELLEIAK
ncbi:MAG: hypothetical protein J2P46_09370 [Zavarzinella sp.]|nr:hypothetical protein [Zavarzinella sp.]